MGYAVRFYDHAMRGAIAERVADRIAIGQEAVRCNLRLADHALAQIVQKFQGRVSVTLADAPADDCLSLSGHADENILVTFGRIGGLQWQRN